MSLSSFSPGLLGLFQHEKKPNRGFSVTGFFQTYLFKASLFPALTEAAVSWINNSKRGLARSCAADDLELSLGNDQIELFDNYLAPQGKQPHHDAGAGFGFSSNLDQTFSDGPSAWGFEFPAVPDLASTPSLSSSYQTSVSSYPGTGFDNPPIDIHSRSHFAMNMVGLYNQPPMFFNDFRRSPRPSVDSPMGGSTSESSVSFMDELFLKNGPQTSNLSQEMSNSYTESPPVSVTEENNRKRKIADSPASSALFLDQEIDSYKKIKVENPASVPMTESDCHIGRFGLRKDYRLRQEREAQECSPESDKKNEARHVCPDCNASFKVKSYLTRHARKHTDAMAFVCPFHDISAVDNFGNVIKSASKCHPTGGFSRRDTYKTHLKALHFIYPPGTKSSARNTTGGRCAGCFEYFESNTRWLTYHIECDQCKGLQEHGRSVKNNGVKSQRNADGNDDDSALLKTECCD